MKVKCYFCGGVHENPKPENEKREYQKGDVWWFLCEKAAGYAKGRVID